MARAALDADEARWLREAQRLQIWREVGCSTLLEYIEDRLGYTPRAAHERLRVAFALAALPELALAMECGELPFTAVRELTRVATAETEGRWLEACAGKRVHEIEKLVAGRRPGDLPGDPIDPSIVPVVLRHEVMPSTAALLKAARQALAAERGEALDDDAFFAALANLALADQTVDAEATIGRAKFQVAVTICETCRNAWSDVAGAAARLDAAEIARAGCDAQHVGRVDGTVPERAHQDVSPSTRRLVFRRDRGTCRVPGCRATAHLEVHHVVAQECGGSHEPDNLILLCDGHHAALHRGTLTIRGDAPDNLVFDRPEAVRLDYASNRVQVKRALVRLGFKPAVAAAALDSAAMETGFDVSLEGLMRAAIRQCPYPGQTFDAA